MSENETKQEKGRTGQKQTAKALRERRGKAPSEIVAENKARNQIRKTIAKALEQGPQTVPEIAEATGLPSHQVLWHLMAMKKYGKLAEGQLRGDYYEYALCEKQEEQK